MADKYGVERLAFFTVGFPDPQPDPKEAARRMNALRTGVLAERYDDYVCVYERGGKNGKIHFHLVLACKEDIRTGADFEAIEVRKDYRSANPALRAEWAFWRGVTNYDGKRAHLARYPDVGRAQLMPVKSTAEGIRKYVAKYIEKHMEGRRPEDKGVRLLRMSSGLSKMTVNFAWHSPRSTIWRKKVELFARRNGCHSLNALAEKFGPRWAFKFRAQICQERIPRNSSGIYARDKGREEVDLWFVDLSDTILRLKEGGAADLPEEEWRDIRNHYLQPFMQAADSLPLNKRVVVEFPDRKYSPPPKVSIPETVRPPNPWRVVEPGLWVRTARD